MTPIVWYINKSQHMYTTIMKVSIVTHIIMTKWGHTIYDCRESIIDVERGVRFVTVQVRLGWVRYNRQIPL